MLPLPGHLHSSLWVPPPLAPGLHSIPAAVSQARDDAAQCARSAHDHKATLQAHVQAARQDWQHLLQTCYTKAGVWLLFGQQLPSGFETTVAFEVRRILDVLKYPNSILDYSLSKFLLL